MTDLCRLAEKYGTDKARWYTPVYDLLLRDRREQVTKVLEIGIGTKEAMHHVPGYKPGASLRMWQDYFPRAEIFGMDKDADVVSELCGHGFYTIQADQGADHSGMMIGLGPFDLIVDDGSHVPAHQILGANTLVPYIKPGGLYIIEDVNNFEEISQGIDYHALCISYPTTSNPAARCMVIRG